MTELDDRSLTYGPVGATRPDLAAWTPPAGFRSHQSTTRIGHGDADWTTAEAAVRRWAVKTRSGFSVEPTPDHDVVCGERCWIRLTLGPISVLEPVEVVAVTSGPSRQGFAYGTLQGHPVSGEEAFVVHRSIDGDVWFTLRSLTRAPHGRWRAAYPMSLVAQQYFRRRYRRALLGGRVA
jgi:uncharacterized protein (UPF0548 family)